MKRPKFTFWKAILVIILIPGLYSLVYRLTHGLGQSTNLTDDFRGDSVGRLQTLFRALAGGGFTLAAVVYIFNSQTLSARASRHDPHGIGYFHVHPSLILDLGRPYPSGIHWSCGTVTP